jgi:hypothetical protein
MCQKVYQYQGVPVQMLEHRMPNIKTSASNNNVADFPSIVHFFKCSSLAHKLVAYTFLLKVQQATSLMLVVTHGAITTARTRTSRDRIGIVWVIASKGTFQGRSVDSTRRS